MKSRTLFLLLLSLFVVSLCMPHISVADEKLVINEVLTHPTTGQNEWVELFGPVGLDVHTYWIDDDISFADDIGNSKKQQLLAVALGSDQNHYVFTLPTSMFNNAGDQIVLFDSNGSLIDSFTYTKDPGVDVTLGRSPDGEGEIQALAVMTKGSPNSSPLPTNTPTPEPTQKPIKEPTPTKQPTPTKTVPTSSPTNKATSVMAIDSTKNYIAQNTYKAPPASMSSYPTAVLGIQATRIPMLSKPRPTGFTLVKSAQKFPVYIPFISGIVILSCAILLFLRKWKKL